jgi:ABC-type Fe3+-siderophore transport system permease subunit
MCVSADSVAHYLIPDRILQVNAICALIGAPILIVSFFRRTITPDAHA